MGTRRRPMLRARAPFLFLLLAGVYDSVEGAGGGGCGPVNETLVHETGLFWMCDHLEWGAVAATMGFVIVFTIFCEYVVARTRKWIKHFNPLLMPCVDKVIAELMILGAMAFSILLVNELTKNSLANGSWSWMTVSTYHTLHWIDTTIFIFAIIYVVAACFLLTLSEVGSDWLGSLDETSRAVMKVSVGADGLESPEVEALSGTKYYLIKQLQYRLLKRHFLKTFFHDPVMKFDFVFYIELCHVGGMTSSFDIGIGEWILLLAVCLITTQDVGSLKYYHIFTIMTGILLIISIVVGFIVTNELGQILTENYDDIDNPSNLDQLSAAAGVKTDVKKKGAKTEMKVQPSTDPTTTPPTGDEEAPPVEEAPPTEEEQGVEGDEAAKKMVQPSSAAGPPIRKSSSTKHQGYFHHFLTNPHTPHNPHSRPDMKKIFICGLGLTERHLFKFVQWQLLVICFYLAVFVMNFISLSSLPSYSPRHIGSDWVWIPLSMLLINLFLVMPYVMFFGFSLAALVNADSKALKEIGSLKQEGETALLYFQHMTALVYGQLDAELSQEQKIEEIFKQWAGSDVSITDVEVMNQMTSFATEHDHMEFYMDRPKLLAMMRLVDDDRNGSLEKGEFQQFVMDCIAKEEKTNNNPNVPESLIFAVAEIQDDMSKDPSVEDLEAITRTLQGLLQDVEVATKAAKEVSST